MRDYDDWKISYPPSWDDEVIFCSKCNKVEVNKHTDYCKACHASDCQDCGEYTEDDQVAQVAFVDDRRQRIFVCQKCLQNGLMNNKYVEIL